EDALACLAGIGGSRSSGSCRIKVPVPQKDVEVALIARSSNLYSEPAKSRLAYAGRAALPAEADLLKPKLYALTIG
ncbi:hypothetical protein J8J40_35365, partial [Mycobacterium tuberculosis]|nr:hypothetical protein [Mycobacterium tuberculosis]